MRLSPQHAARLGLASRPAKYRNRVTHVDGLRFDSAKEARIWGELQLRQKAGELVHLERQARFPLVVAGLDCGAYVADYAWIEANGEYVVADAKSAITRRDRVYRLKRKLMRALHGVDIREL